MSAFSGFLCTQEITDDEKKQTTNSKLLIEEPQITFGDLNFIIIILYINYSWREYKDLHNQRVNKFMFNLLSTMSDGEFNRSGCASKPHVSTIHLYRKVRRLPWDRMACVEAEWYQPTALTGSTIDFLWLSVMLTPQSVGSWGVSAHSRIKTDLSDNLLRSSVK